MGTQLGRRQLISNFFYDYEKRVNQVLRASPGAAFEPSKVFAPYLVESNAEGLRLQKTEESTAKSNDASNRRLSFLESGARWMKISSLVSQPIDDFHSLVRVHWDSAFDARDGHVERVDFDVTYLVRREDESAEYKIFCTINGDERKALREKGLIPG